MSDGAGEGSFGRGRVDLERSLRLYGWFAPLSGVAFWTPVFFLYFSERFPVAQVLQLEALYYASVVLLEVPSGYFSDRVGRRATLLVASSAWVVGYAFFVFGGASFLLFAIAQVGKAVGFAFLSGTETSFHFDTLKGLGREDEYGRREARIARNRFLATAVGALLGGASGSLALQIPYALSLGLALGLIVIALGMREPPRSAGGFATHGFGAQLVACVRQLRSPFLLWLFAYFVLKTTTEHIPYEFSQPYLAQLLGESLDRLRYTPLSSGLLMAGIAFVASPIAARSMLLRDRLGVGGALVLAGGVQLSIIAGMALVVSPLVLPLMLLRSGQSAVSNPIVNAEVTPRVPQAQRATYLSLHSLAGRLGYSAVLFSLSALVGDGDIQTPETLAALLRAAGWGSAVALFVLALSAGALRSRSASVAVEE